MHSGSTYLSAAPFLKWAGGKRWLCQRHGHIFPNNFSKYIEPFLGSAAVYFCLQPKEAYLSDSNLRLIECYRQIMINHGEIHQILQNYQRLHSKQFYYEARSAVFEDPIIRAAQFIYLNRTCWNGLYRVNKNGAFNVPIGTKNCVLFSYDDFGEVSRRLFPAHISDDDFEDSIDHGETNDFIFVDPPYTVKHNLNGFVKYNQTIFSWDDQLRLKNSLDRAVKRGANFLMTNANHHSIKELYSAYRQMPVDRTSILSGDPSYRSATKELIITSW